MTVVQHQVCRDLIYYVKLKKQVKSVVTLSYLLFDYDAPFFAALKQGNPG